MQLGTTESKLSSVIIPGRLDNWSSTKLDDDHPLAQFHSKFWGKSLETEEKQWRDAQGDSSDTEPGCYALEIGIPGIRVDKIWIRAEYIEIYDYFEDYYNQAGGFSRCPRGRADGATRHRRVHLLYYGQPMAKIPPWVQREEYVDLLRYPSAHWRRKTGHLVLATDSASVRGGRRLSITSGFRTVLAQIHHLGDG